MYVVIQILDPISRTDLSLLSYHFVLDLSPKTDLSLFVKLAHFKYNDKIIVDVRLSPLILEIITCTYSMLKRYDIITAFDVFQAPVLQKSWACIHKRA